MSTLARTQESEDRLTEMMSNAVIADEEPRDAPDTFESGGLG